MSGTILLPSRRSADTPHTSEAHPLAVTDKPSDKLFGIFENVAEALILAGIVLYVSGVSYLHGYYGAFGVSPRELGFSMYDTLVQNITLVGSRPWLSTAGILVLLAAAAAVRLVIARVLRFRQAGLLAAIVVGAFAIPVLAYAAGTAGADMAYRDMVNTSGTLPLVAIAADPAKLPSALLNSDMIRPDGYVELGYKLLAHGNNGYYFFAPVKGAARAGNLTVIFIPADAIRGISFQVARRKD
jgi:hypothetical protein